MRESVEGGIDIKAKMGQALMQRLQPKEKQLVDRFKGALRGQNIEDMLKRFAKD